VRSNFTNNRFLILLGKITKTRGNKGEVVLAPSPNLQAYALNSGERVVLKSVRYQKENSIESIKDVQGITILKFKDTHSISDALKLVGYELFATSEENLDTSQLGVMDYTVFDIHHNRWGTVKNIQEFSLNQILEVTGDSGKIIYVPFADDIIKNVDKEKREITIDPPEGLKELNLN